MPHDLPPVLALPRSTTSKLEEAMYLLGQVEMCGRLLPSPTLLTYGSLLNEAIASSTIEGTIASPEELIKYQLGLEPEREQVREVANYREALAEGVAHLRENPISLSVLKNLHARLLRGVRGSGIAGQFKKQQNHVGWDAAEGRPVFTPPPPEHTLELMTNLEAYATVPQSEPKLVQVALTHYQFETIHPFGDGNGRVGRLLIVLQLLQLGLLSAPLVYPSVFFERNRSNYYDGLQNVREKGDWISWIDYFVDAIIHQSQETIGVAQLLLSLQEELRGSIANIQAHASVQRVLACFFRKPVLSVTEAMNLAGVARNTAKTALARLAEFGVLEEMTGPRNARIYLCSPIFGVLSSKFRNEEGAFGTR
jgi:Fic family protein